MQTSYRIDGYTILFDAYAKHWLITRRGNHIGSGYSLEEALAWVMARSAQAAQSR